MPAFLLVLAGWFGISPLRLIIYGAAAISVVVGAVSIRQHYINRGWDSAIHAIEKQNSVAADAARRAQRSVDQCYDEGGTWSTITGTCTLEVNP